MRYDKTIEEALRIGERIVSVMPSERAGHVFGEDRKPKRRHKAYPRREYIQVNKLHTMANWYRPKGIE